MPAKCEGCGSEFPSRNSMFRHLKATNGACLSPQAYQDFNRYVLLQDRKKVLLLYGYLILPSDSKFPEGTPWHNSIENGHDAAGKLLQTLEEHCLPTGEEPSKEIPKINRSYGNTGRNFDALQQDDRTGAMTEVLATRLPALAMASEDWLDSVNELLDSKGYPIRIFGRLDMPHSKFNAEMDVTHRRVEYLLPADFLLPGQPLELESFYESLPSFIDGFRNYKNAKEQSTIGAELEALNEETDQPSDDTKTYLFKLKKTMQSLATKVVELDSQNDAAVLEKRFSIQKRKRQCYKSEKKTLAKDKQRDSKCNAEVKESLSRSEETKSRERGHKEKDGNGKVNQKHAGNNNKGSRVLRRRRFHNFTDFMMAHEYFSYRRMDRMYHRATLRFPDHVYDKLAVQQKAGRNLDRKRPFLVISISGDMFLHGQVCRVVGLLIALARGLIDEDFVDCVFDEDYPHLVPTPEAPSFAMYATESHYTQWEGKVKKTLTPRKCNKFHEGWHDHNTLRRVNEWQTITREEIAKVWLSKGVDPSSKRLRVEREWARDVLGPWAVAAQKQLEEYRCWRQGKQTATNSSTSDDIPSNFPISLPPLSSIDDSVPAIYQKVLQCLREADESGNWPSTTPKRQMVMISTPTDESNGDSGINNPKMSSLSMAHWVARNNKKLERSSAYSFHEGDGGASGSFSVGAMPGEHCVQPKANQLFPDLMKAAFELEHALCPDREPSSTIAINRNAQVSFDCNWIRTVTGRVSVASHIH